MASFAHKSPPILLQGAPDINIGTTQDKSKVVQVMQLDMSNDVLEELLAYSRQGKTPQIQLGRNPVCLSPCAILIFA
jgi:RNA polymerase II elongation factor ELL